MGQFLASAIKTFVVGVFALWIFFVVFPHPDRRIVAQGLLLVLAVIVYASIGLWRDLKSEYPVEKPRSTGKTLAAMERSIMDEIKPWFQSRTILGGAGAMIAGGGQLFGYAITPADQAALVDSAQQLYTLVGSFVSVVGGLLAIWGRLRATKAIGSVKSA